MLSVAMEIAGGSIRLRSIEKQKEVALEAYFVIVYCSGARSNGVSG